MAEAFAVVALSSRISVLLAHDRHGTPASESALNSRVVGYRKQLPHITLHAGYAASRISSNLRGSTKQFGWLQAPATKKFLPFNNFCKPRNHPN